MHVEMDKGKLSAWERWELASFDDPDRLADKAASEAEAPAEAAPEIQLPSEEEVAAIRTAAYEEGMRLGREEGYAQGHSAGFQEGRTQASDDGQRLATLALQLDTALAGMNQEVAEELLALALELARQVVRQVVAVKPEMLLGVVQEAVAQMPHVHAMIHLHPEDASLVRSYLGDQLAHAGHRLIEDPRLARGDCSIEAGSSQLDATVATRWRRVAESLGLNNDWLLGDDKAAP